MEHLFATLTRALESTPVIALGAAVLWGVLSILLSPCHLVSIPLMVGYVAGQGRTSARAALGMSCLFAGGIFVTIAVIGGISAAAGSMLGTGGEWANYVVAGVFFLVGLHLLGVISLPLPGPGQIAFKRRGMLGALALGLIFGAAAGPCTFAYMASMLAVVFKLGAGNVVRGMTLLMAYGLGHCAVIVLAGTSTELVQKYLNWNEKSKGVDIARKVCGLLILLGGVYLIYKA